MVSDGFLLKREDRNQKDIYIQLIDYSEREEYPLSEKYITKITDNLYRLECEDGNFLGVGRFILGLLGEVKIIEPETLKDYVQERLNAYNA